MHHHISPEYLIHDSHLLVMNVCNDNVQSSYEEATVNSTWQAAMIQEFEALHANHKWDLVTLPPGKQAIGCR